MHHRILNILSVRSPLRLVCLFCLLCAAAHPLVALDDPWTVRVRFASYKYMPHLTHAVPVGLELPEPGKETALRLSNRSFSEPHTLRIDGSLRLYPEGVLDYAAAQPLCEMMLPPGTKNWLVMVFSTGGEGAQYRMVLVADDAFPGGSVHFLNASQYPIGGMIDDDVFEVLPGKQYNYPNPSKRSDRIRISVNFAYNEEDEWKRLSSSRWTFDPEVRTLMVCFWDATFERLRFFGISDTSPQG